MRYSPESFKARIQIDTRFILAASLLLGGLFVMFYQHAREEEDNQWVVHTYQVIDQLKAIEALLVDAETGARGYVATGDTQFLQPYHQALPTLSTNLRQLPQLVADNPAQQRQVLELERLAKAKVAVVQQIVNPAPSVSPRQLLTLGKQRMDAVRRQVASMIAVEQALMKVRDQRVKTAYRNTNVLTVLLLVLALFAFAHARLLIRRELKRRQEAQADARISAQLLQNVIDNVPSGLVLYQAVRSPTGQIIDFIHTLSNPANDRITGRSAGELLNLSMLEHYPDNRTNGFFDDLVKVIETGQPLHRLIHYEANNFSGWFDTQYAKQDDGVLFTYLDVTALKEAELTQQQQAQALQAANRELQRSNTSLQSFAYIASHDLQEPLRKIDSFSNLLESEYGPQLDDKAADYLRRMRLAAKRMSLLIRDLLAYSRLSSTPTVFEPVSILALVTDIVDDLEIAITKSGVQITVGELPDVPGDPTQLRQLLQNLISNAIKFTHMPAGAAQVAITSRPVNGTDMATSADGAADAQKLFWEISVQDNGIGFDPKYLDRIFEVFQRLNSRQQFAGSGIGLAICKRVAENHGGWITAESQPGQGATFRVYLPAEP